jgi:hypothetical protein
MPVSATMNINKDTLVTTDNNRGQLTVRHGDLYSGRLPVIRGSSFVNSRVVEIGQRFLIEIRETDVVQEFSV